MIACLTNIAVRIGPVVCETETDALKLATFKKGVGAKRRRLDEDYVLALQTRTASMSITSGVVARALGEMAQYSASMSDERGLRHYLAESQLRLGEGEQFGCTYDAARLGQPAEETICFMLEDLDRDIAAWLPPQVHMAGKSCPSVGLVGEV